jgi:hypothetical protein
VKLPVDGAHYLNLLIGYKRLKYFDYEWQPLFQITQSWSFRYLLFLFEAVSPVFINAPARKEGAATDFRLFFWDQFSVVRLSLDLYLQKHVTIEKW